MRWRRRLGERIGDRELEADPAIPRPAAGKTPTDAARSIDANVSKISRLELGQSGIAYGDLKLLLEYYGDEPEHIEWMLELSRGNRERGRWTGHRETFPDWFRAYVDLERDAEDIRWSEIEQVPGLLQTEAYMRALYDAMAPLGGPTDVDAAIRSRLERQEILQRDSPPTLSFIISEACVRQLVGGRTVMAEQIDHLAGLAGNRNIQLQLRAFDADSVVGVSARFIMLRIPSPSAGQPLEFVYCEDFDGARYIDDNRTVREYNALWGAMQAAALSPLKTRGRLRELAKQLTEGSPDDRR